MITLMRLMFTSAFVRVFQSVTLIVILTTLFVLVWKGVSYLLPFALPSVYIGFVAASMSLWVAILLLRQERPLSATENEQQLQGLLGQYQTLYLESPVPYLTIDQKGKVQMYNLAAARLFQTTVKAMTGNDLGERFRHESDNELSVLLGKLQSKVTINETEAQIETMRGELRWVIVSVFASEQSTERLVALVDITHQKLVDTAKSEFVALATHQLRTPITAIRWNTELLANSIKETRNEKQAMFIDKIDRNISRMLALINDFLSVSKLETGTFETAAETFDLKEFMDSVVEEYESTFTKKQIALTTSFEPQPLSFTADTRLMHIIVSNLLSNAVKYTPDGKQVSLSYIADQQTVTITVSDQGIGVPEGELENLFTKFYRASNAQSYRTEGTGLGLSIVKQSVEKMGGTINVHSEENVGTVFTVQLPRT